MIYLILFINKLGAGRLPRRMRTGTVRKKNFAISLYHKPLMIVHKVVIAIIMNELKKTKELFVTKPAIPDSIAPKQNNQYTISGFSFIIFLIFCFLWYLFKAFAPILAFFVLYFFI